MSCSPVDVLPARGSPPPSTRAELGIAIELIKWGVTEPMRCRGTSSAGYLNRATHAVLAVSGVLFSMVGLVLALGGYLLPESSAFDVVRAEGSSDRLFDQTSGRRNERISAMMYDWQTSLRASDYQAARIVPPATVEETGWDILLALHSDRHCQLGLPRLASIVSVPPAVADRWLAALEERALITGARHPSTDELLALLTEKGRELLDRYFSATDGLHVGSDS